MSWFDKHKETISILTLIAGAMAAGMAVGFVLILLANLWKIW
jgi:hypothetical protein